MAILVFQHEPHETSARLGEVFNAYGHRLRTVRLHDGDPLPPDLDDVDGVLSMGGSMNVDQADAHPWMKPEIDYLKAAHDADLPVIGVCLGAQLLAVALGGEVAPMEKPEIGWGPVTQSFFGTIDPVYAGIPWTTTQFHLHGQQITQPPPGGTPAPLASSTQCKCQAFKVGFRTYGFQYHFEWDQNDIQTMLEQPGTRQHADVHSLREQMKTCYPKSRRHGDRLAHRLALCLAPIDKRFGVLT